MPLPCCWAAGTALQQGGCRFNGADPPPASLSSLRRTPRNNVSHISGRRVIAPKRLSRPRDEKLLRAYANEAARLREYAANTTTGRLRARLLEEAANHERLAKEVSAGRTGFVTVKPDASAL